MRLIPLTLLALLFVLPASAAEVKKELSGMPAVLPSGLIMVDGKDVQLWGIDQLANDQECWHDNRAWSCGEEALTVLRHFVMANHVHCAVKEDLGAGKFSGQCFRVKNGKDYDVARYLVIQGWARDDAAQSNGLYADDEADARDDRRGIWTSRFQSAADWKNGVAHYVEYKMAPPKPPFEKHTGDTGGWRKNTQ